jgi:hypothetical protein
MVRFRRRVASQGDKTFLTLNNNLRTCEVFAVVSSGGRGDIYRRTADHTSCGVGHAGGPAPLAAIPRGSTRTLPPPRGRRRRGLRNMEKDPRCDHASRILFIFAREMSRYESAGGRTAPAIWPSMATCRLLVPLTHTWRNWSSCTFGSAFHCWELRKLVVVKTPSGAM